MTKPAKVWLRRNKATAAAIRAKPPTMPTRSPRLSDSHPAGVRKSIVATLWMDDSQPIWTLERPIRFCMYRGSNWKAMRKVTSRTPSEMDIQVTIPPASTNPIMALKSVLNLAKEGFSRGLSSSRLSPRAIHSRIAVAPVYRTPEMINKARNPKYWER